jgi:hypothetical protein
MSDISARRSRTHIAQDPPVLIDSATLSTRYAAAVSTLTMCKHRRIVENGTIKSASFPSHPHSGIRAAIPRVTATSSATRSSSFMQNGQRCSKTQPLRRTAPRTHPGTVSKMARTIAVPFSQPRDVLTEIQRSVSSCIELIGAVRIKSRNSSAVLVNDANPDSPPAARATRHHLRRRRRKRPADTLPYSPQHRGLQRPLPPPRGTQIEREGTVSSPQ